MKKEYMQPTIEIISLESENIMDISANVGFDKDGIFDIDPEGPWNF